MSSEDFTAVRSLLSSTKLSALLKPMHVVTIPEHASTDQALRVRMLCTPPSAACRPALSSCQS